MTKKQVLADRAVVIGAGVGGLFAAGALRKYFHEVVLLERDALPAEVEFRKGVPQGPHGHAVLKRGENVAEGFFPGFRRELRAAGGVLLDFDKDAARNESGQWSLPAETGLTISSQSRALLEHVLRKKALACDNVSIREGVRCSAPLLLDGRVVGVELDAADGSSERLEADLVIDASGRGSTTHKWLEKNGFGEVFTERLGIDLVYVTGIFKADSLEDGSPLLCTVRQSPPGKRGGTTMPIEGTRWMVTLNGRQGDVPPLDFDGFFEYAKSLPDPIVHDRMCSSKLEGQLRRFKIPESYWRHYEQMERFPDGLIPIGDAVAGFNPVFGQGMSAAAVDAEQLELVLAARSEFDAGLDGLYQEYLPRIAEAIGAAWGGTSIYDLMYEGTQGERSEDYPQRRAAFLAMQELARDDSEVRRLQMMVGNMLEPPSVLYTPEIISRLVEYTSGSADG